MYRQVRSQTTEEVRGADGNPIVPVDVVQGIVQQLATVSQHTTTATTAMRHLVSEIAGLRDLRQRDTTTMIEALAGAAVRSGSPGVFDEGVVRTTNPAVRKLQEKDPSFRGMMVTRSTF